MEILTAIPYNIWGHPYQVSPYLCNSGKFLRWKRRHRQKRINKKWQKKYGAVYSKCSGVAYELIGVGFVFCPCIMTALNKRNTA